MRCIVYWNDSKYGSDVKTQAAEDHRAVLPVESRQAKVLDRMMMLILSDVHSLAKLFSAKQDLSSYPDLQHYRDAGDHRCSMEQVLIDSRKALLAMMMGRDMEVESDSGGVSFGTSNESRITRNQAVKNVDMLRYTGTTPKQKKKVLKRYRDSHSDDDECAKRFKECTGRPIERVGVTNLKKKASGARGSCVGCSARTNWWCAECHTWVCHDKSYPANGEPNFIRDIKDYWSYVSGTRVRVKGHVVAKYTCFMHFHPKFLCMPCDRTCSD
jgi:hypothetical protein